MVNLSLTEKGGSTNELSFDKDEVTVGRVRGNDIVLPKGNVSKHHCRIAVHGGEIQVEDLRSTNGTYVNGRKIAEPTPIAQSDKIFVGDFIIRVTSQASSSLEISRPAHPPGPPEAGSLGSAIPRRPPPPAPTARGNSIFDDAPGSAPKAAPAPLAGRSPLPPPPPPPMPIKRESKVVPAISDPFPPPSGPSDINLDDEDDALATPHPHFTVPPLKPAVQHPASAIDSSSEHGERGERELRALTPAPARGRGMATLEMEESPSPVSAPSFDHDLAGAQAGAPPDPEDVFASVGTESRHSSPKAPEPAKPAAPPKGKSAHQPSAKHASRLLDRDVPEWLAHLLESEGVAAAFFTGTNQAEIQRNGRRESASVPASDLATLGTVIRKLVSKGTPKPAPDATAVNTTMPDGMRIAALFPPVADRLCVAIRRPMASGKTIDDLVEERVISPEMRQVLDACVATRQNILVAGDRAACDSLLRAILWSVDRVARVALLSDSISPPASATSWIKLQPEAQAPELVTAAVAMQPEYLVVDANHSALSGEVLAECNLGLEGVILAIVARSTNDALHRLQLLGGAQGSAATISADMVTSSIDLVVQASVLSDGSLKVVEIAEPKASLDGQITAHALLTWIPGDDSAGSFTVTGARSALATKLSSAGSTIPPEILSRQ
jgi:pilus assembly protein CpaF